MEFLLLIWDDIDDISAAFRHMTVCAIDEVAQVPAAMGAAVAACAVWLLRLPS